MIFFFVFFILLYLVNIHFNKLDKDYLNINNTTVINGLFVIIVFFSHFLSYNSGFNNLDSKLNNIIGIMGQLIVTTFLFYSGFGIFCKIKKDRVEYIKSFFKKRFLKVLINFDIAVILFYIVDLFMGKTYSITNILLSLIGWESLGNSNWYIFIVFILYIAVMLIFKLFKNKSNFYCLFMISFVSVIYVILLDIFKEYYWCNSLLCFPAGMWYSYYKEKIDNYILKKYSNCIGVIGLLLFVFALLYFVNDNVFVYNIFCVVFVLIITLLLSLVSSNNKILLFFGKNVFWIYILQRIPMIVFEGKFNIYIYFIICFFITIVLSYILNLFSNLILKKI